MRKLAEEEPIGSDALIIQMAIVAKSMSSSKFTDLLVLSMSHEQTAENMESVLKGFVRE